MSARIELLLVALVLALVALTVALAALVPAPLRPADVLPLRTATIAATPAAAPPLTLSRSEPWPGRINPAALWLAAGLALLALGLPGLRRLARRPASPIPAWSKPKPAVSESSRAAADPAPLKSLDPPARASQPSIWSLDERPALASAPPATARAAREELARALRQAAVVPSTAGAARADEGCAPTRAGSLAQIVTQTLDEVQARSVWLGQDLGPRHCTALLAFDDEAPALLRLGELVAQRSAARCRWCPDGLRIEAAERAPDPGQPAPLLVPLLRPARDTTRLIALDRWRWLGLYGAAATACAHQVLTALLADHAPERLACLLLDPQRRLGGLYHGAPHLLACDQPPAVALERCLAALRAGRTHAERPLLLVLVEPDEATCAVLTPLLRWLARRPDAPLYLLLVEPALRAAAREAYALLPALITADGAGPSAWLPGAPERWPSSGRALLRSRACRWQGAPLGLDEAAAAATLRALPPVDPASLPPTLWQARLIGQAEAVLPDQTPAGSPDAGQDPPDSQGALRLAQLIDGQATSARLVETPADTGDGGWPRDLEPQVRAAELHRLWARIVGDGTLDPALRGGRGAAPGLTLRRLRELAGEQLHPALPQLLVWFDRAGLLEPPRHAAQPFRMPRLLCSVDLDLIRQRLLATAPPPADDPQVIELHGKRR